MLSLQSDNKSLDLQPIVLQEYNIVVRQIFSVIYTTLSCYNPLPRGDPSLAVGHYVLLMTLNCAAIQKRCSALHLRNTTATSFKFILSHFILQQQHYKLKQLLNLYTNSRILSFFPHCLVYFDINSSQFVNKASDVDLRLSSRFKVFIEFGSSRYVVNIFFYSQPVVNSPIRLIYYEKN